MRYFYHIRHSIIKISNSNQCIQLLIDNNYSLKLIFNAINRRLKKLFVNNFLNNLLTTPPNDTVSNSANKRQKKL